MALLCLTAFAVRAQANVVEREVKAAPAAMRAFASIPTSTGLHVWPVAGDQARHPARAWRGQRQRGTLKATDFKQCLATGVRLRRALSRAAEFDGTDESCWNYLAGGRKELHSSG